jgi:hypothetical protein
MQPRRPVRPKSLPVFALPRPEDAFVKISNRALKHREDHQQRTLLQSLLERLKILLRVLPKKVPEEICGTRRRERRSPGRAAGLEPAKDGWNRTKLLPVVILSDPPCAPAGASHGAAWHFGPRAAAAQRGSLSSALSRCSSSRTSGVGCGVVGLRPLRRFFTRESIHALCSGCVST